MNCKTMGCRLVRFVLALSILVSMVGLVEAASPMLRLLKGGKLPPERLPAVVEMVCKKADPEDLTYVFEQVMDAKAYPPALRLQCLGWLADAATINKVKPEGDLSSVKTLLQDEEGRKNPQFTLAVIRLAAVWQVPQMGAELKQILRTTKDASLRRAAIDGLKTLGDDESKAAISELASSGDSTDVRFMATAALAQLDPTAAAKAAANALVKATPQDDSTELVEAFLNRQGGADALAAALADVTLSPDVAKRALRTMYSAGRSDASLSDTLSKAAGIAVDAPPPTVEEIVKIAAEVVEKGDAARGESIFRRADVNCMKCHSVSGAGGTIGPDLSPIGGTSPVEFLVTSVLDPNAAIKEQYTTRNIMTADGLQFSGIVVDRNDQELKLKDASGNVVTVATADIEEEIEGRSLMPQGLTKFLTHEEFLDLAKFLSELGKPGPYAIRSRPTVQRWRVLRTPNEALLSEVPNIELLREWVLGAPEEAWLPVYGKVAGQLPLDEVSQQINQPVLYLQGTVEVREAGPVGLKLASNSQVQGWLGVNPLDNQQELITQLEPGVHTLTLRVVPGKVTAPELMAEFFKPENSTAEFSVK